MLDYRIIGKYEVVAEGSGLGRVVCWCLGRGYVVICARSEPAIPIFYENHIELPRFHLITRLTGDLVPQISQAAWRGDAHPRAAGCSSPPLPS